MTEAPKNFESYHPDESFDITNHSRRINLQNFKINYEYQAAKLKKTNIYTPKSFEATNTTSQTALNPLHSL